jgi:hypothetical protein
MLSFIGVLQTQRYRPSRYLKDIPKKTTTYSIDGLFDVSYYKPTFIIILTLLYKLFE